MKKNSNFCQGKTILKKNYLYKRTHLLKQTQLHLKLLQDKNKSKFFFWFKKIKVSLVRPCVGLHFNYYTISYVYESDFILKIFFFLNLF